MLPSDKCEIRAGVITTRLSLCPRKGGDGMLPISINIDTSDCVAKLTLLQAACKPERFNRALYRIYNRTGSHVRQILKKDLPHDYVISPSKVGKAVGSASIQGMGCIIPVRDKRGSIGGQYSASGGAHGWNSKHHKYKVKARIVKGGQSTLPGAMSSYGGEPPFRNLGSKLGKLTFTRAGKKRFPIMKVSGIAIPQMPMNRSLDEVQEDIVKFLKVQIEHEFMNVMAGR